MAASPAHSRAPSAAAAAADLWVGVLGAGWSEGRRGGAGSASRAARRWRARRLTEAAMMGAGDAEADGGTDADSAGDDDDVWRGTGGGGVDGGIGLPRALCGRVTVTTCWLAALALESARSSRAPSSHTSAPDSDPAAAPCCIRCRNGETGTVEGLVAPPECAWGAACNAAMRLLSRRFRLGVLPRERAAGEDGNPAAPCASAGRAR